MHRTFDGAYIRTALGQFSFALVVLKIFTSEFYSFGAIFAAYGFVVLVISVARSRRGNDAFFEQQGESGLKIRMFRTSGNVVVALTAFTVVAYISLLVMVLRLD